MIIKYFFHFVILYASICFGGGNVLNAQEVTSIDFYGARALSIQQLEKALEIASGKPLGLKTREIEKRLKSLEGVEDASVVQIQYPGNLALFIGIRETGQAQPKLRNAPTGPIRLAPNLIESYDETMKMLMPAIQASKAGEDRSAGHSLSEYPPMRKKQEQLIAIADKQLSNIGKVLRESSDEKSRGAAAYILAFASDKKVVARELQYACNDASSLVRNNAVRALGVLAAFDQKNDEVTLDIPYHPFLQLLKSLTWTDRNKGAALIDAMSVNRDVVLFNTLKEKYMRELKEMARWKSSGHALFAIRILARMAQFDEDEIRQRSKAASSYEDRMKWVDDLLDRISKQS